MNRPTKISVCASSVDLTCRIYISSVNGSVCMLRTKQNGLGLGKLSFVKDFLIIRSDRRD